MSATAIRIQDWSRHFGPVRAVDRFTAEVPAGIAFAFLGRNVAGKTTTIRFLLGLLEPTPGRADNHPLSWGWPPSQTLTSRESAT